MYKFLILLVYFERPNIVLNALKSLNDIRYQNFEVVIIDDGSRVPIEPIARIYLNPDVLEKCKFIYTGDTIEYKQSIGGTRHGMFMNQAMEKSDADLGIILCDDDAIYPDCLDNANRWFINNPNKGYMYGHVIPFNPENQHIGSHLPRIDVPVNKMGDISPACQIDASQIVFKLDAVKNHGVRFPEVGMGALDAALFVQLETLYGLCSFGGFYTEYKGVFFNQLGTRFNKFETGDI